MTAAASGTTVQRTPEEQAAYEDGYAEAWTLCSNMARPPTVYVPVRATWGQLYRGAIILDQDAVQWMITRFERIASGLAITVESEKGSWSWPMQAGGPGKDPDEPVWFKETCHAAEAHLIAGAEKGTYVLKRTIEPLPPAADPSAPVMWGTWRMTGLPV